MPKFIDTRYSEFYQNNGYVPEMFNPYNMKDLGETAIAPTISTQCGSLTSSAAVLIRESLDE